MPADAHLSPSTVSITPAVPEGAATHRLPAEPDSCFWGYLSPEVEPVLTVASGDIVEVEALTHHAGDAPDLLMDDGIRAVWDAIDPADRGPGVHIMTGPIAVEGAQPGDTVAVTILDMAPRLPYGSNCAANWGLLYDTYDKERITIYELVDAAGGGLGEGAFGRIAQPSFGFDFTELPLYDVPGVITPPDDSARQPFTREVAVPVRPHFGVCGVAPPEPGRISSIPPGVFGGNVDNWRLGPGATMYYPVFVEGARLYVGDPHFAQGDGEICGTAIEASLDARIRIDLVKDLPLSSPLLETESHWFTHGFGDDLDAAMRMAAEQMLDLLVERFGCSRDDAYSLASVAIDLGVTQVVDGTLGCHAGIDRSILVGG
ncbi:MAG: acetamidase/formamidase family protein [Actinomycetota bacterium]